MARTNKFSYLKGAKETLSWAKLLTFNTVCVFLYFNTILCSIVCFALVKLWFLCVFLSMSDALSDDGSDINQDDRQEDVMTPAELIAKLEEVSRR